MGSIRDEIKQTRPFASLAEEAVVTLLGTADRVRSALSLVVDAHGITLQQYNVLRILRGAPEGLPCGEIGNRMITRDPDITRLLDRIEKRRLISRNRHDQDRRVVLTRITGEGLALLERLDEPVLDLHRRLFGHLGTERLEMLRQLLEECRTAAG